MTEEVIESVEKTYTTFYLTYFTEREMFLQRVQEFNLLILATTCEELHEVADMVNSDTTVTIGLTGKLFHPTEPYPTLNLRKFRVKKKLLYKTLRLFKPESSKN